MSAFETLGLGVGLRISDEEIRDAFRLKAVVLHPDMGGDEVGFAKLQLAQETLLSPAKRLKEWIAAQGMEVDARGQIEGGLMELFQKVSDTGAAAEALIRENAGAKSALVKAMVEVRLMAERERVKSLLETISKEIGKRVDCFGEIEPGEIDAGVVMRDLIFLEKWSAVMKGLYGRLL